MSVISENLTIVEFSLPDSTLSIGGLPGDPSPPDDFQLEGILPGAWVAEMYPGGLYLYHAQVRHGSPLKAVAVAPRFGVLAIGATLWYESLAIHAFLDEDISGGNKDAFAVWRKTLQQQRVLGVAFGVLYHAAGLRHQLYTQTVNETVVGIYLKQG